MDKPAWLWRLHLSFTSDEESLVFADNEIVNDLIWRFAGLFAFSCLYKLRS